MTPFTVQPEMVADPFDALPMPDDEPDDTAVEPEGDNNG